MFSLGKICFLKLSILFTFVWFINSTESTTTQVVKRKDAASLYPNSLDFVGLVEYMGRKAVEYNLVTEDGYILKIFRLPPNTLADNKKRRIPVYIQHPFLGTADVFVLRGPEFSLPIILSDAGYDVWLGNNRGSTYGRKHVKLSPEDSEFWNYNLDDHSLKDLPANIDFVLNATNSSTLSYIGMSLGTLLPKILLSERPEYNKKINVFINLASVGYLRDHNSNWKFFDTFYKVYFRFTSRDKPFEFFPRNNVLHSFIQKVCLANKIFKRACISLSDIVNGEDYEQSLETNEVLATSLYYPAGTSSNIFWHFYQFLYNGTFEHYDHGSIERNMKYYGQPTPPAYNISNIDVPMYFFHGHHDLFSTPINDQAFTSQLRNNRKPIYVIVDWPKFNHVDFIIAKDVRKLVFDKVIEILEEFNYVKT